MTVKELIVSLLDVDMDKEVTIQYPTAEGLIVGNYSRYDVAKDFVVKEYNHGLIIGVEE